MEEKTNESAKEKSADTVNAEANEAVAETVHEEPAKTTNNKLRNALLRVLAAFLAVVVLLAVTSFSFIDLIKGPKDSDSVQDEEVGAFVKRDIYAIVGFYVDETTASDEITGRYALVPMGGKFVTVHFTKRYLESVDTIMTETYDYINGNIYTLDKYVVVQGTTGTISEDLSAQMYDWFALNKDWMVESGVIADTDDNAEYLSDTILLVDTVNSMDQNLVYVLTGLLAVCLLYIIVELILMATGFYLDKPKKKRAVKDIEENSGEDAEEEPEETDGGEEDDKAEADEEKNASDNVEQEENKEADDGVECIKCDDKSENNGCSETAETENFDAQEDKQ